MKILYIISIILCSIVARGVIAKPFSPKNESLVLAILPASTLHPETQNIAQLKQHLQSEPDNHHVAFELAETYIEMAKDQNDPRYYGLAEALIKPWWNDDSNINLMLIKAKVLGFNHDFSQALHVLNKILNTRTHTQALLMRANLNLVIGNYDKVKQDCTRLLLKTSSLVTAGCFFSVNGFTSNPAQTRVLIAQLRAMLATTEKTHFETTLWLLGLAAEAASLNNDWSIAEQLMLTGISIKADDSYLLSLYADLLLKQGRFQHCIDLLKPHIQQTALLVRFLAAETRLSGITTHRVQQKNLEIRINEDALKGDQRHLREYAYYQLYVKKDYPAALHNALENWKNQKELIDSLILYRVANIAKQKDVLKMLSDWRKTNHIQVDFAAQSLRI